MKRIGITVANVNNKTAPALRANGLVRLVDGDTGEEIAGITSVDFHASVDGVISVTATFFVTMMGAYDLPQQS